MKKIKSIGIIGVGKLGKTLAKFFHSIGMLEFCIDKELSNLEEFAGLVPIHTSIANLDSVPDLLLLSLTESGIAAMDNDLAQVFGSQLNGIYVAHTSGSNTYRLLDSSASRGAIALAIHPYQTFYNSRIEDLQKISWLINHPCKLPEIENIIQLSGGKFNYMYSDDANQKARYHASAVVISNFMNIIFELSAELIKTAGLNPKEFIPPIAITTLENNINNMDKSIMPLTGPIVRGEKQVILSHIDALSGYPELLKAYNHIGLAALEILKLKNIDSAEILNSLQRIFLNSNRNLE